MDECIDVFRSIRSFQVDLPGWPIPERFITPAADHMITGNSRYKRSMWCSIRSLLRILCKDPKLRCIPDSSVQRFSVSGSSC